MDYSMKDIEKPTIPYPKEAFPPLLQNAIAALHEDTGLPLEMIGSTVLASAALACQAYIDAESPFGGTPEPTSLYFLTLAEASEGKSTLYNKVMKPFETFASMMREEYKQELHRYQKCHQRWKIKESALKSRLRKAIKNDDVEAEEEVQLQLDEHRDKIKTDQELCKPKKFNLIYEDATFKAFIEGLADQPNAAIFSSEAITFFKGRLKNNLGLLNKAWGAEVYPHHRPEEEDLELKARLTLLLLVQPGTFMRYLAKNGDEADLSGFLSRFLFTLTTSTLDSRKINLDYSRSDEELKKLHERITTLLNEQKAIFVHGASDVYSTPSKELMNRKDDRDCRKEQQQNTSQYVTTQTKESKDEEINESSSSTTPTGSLLIEPKDKCLAMLTSEAKDVFSAKASEYQTNKKWGHIRSYVGKAHSHAIRIAAISSVVKDEDTAITSLLLIDAYKIVEWHLEQVSALFYPMSEEYRFKEDVYKLFAWIKDRFENPATNAMTRIPGQKGDIMETPILRNDPFPLQDIRTSGPYRFRSIDVLYPLLRELIAIGLICTIRYCQNGASHVARLTPNLDQFGQLTIMGSPGVKCFSIRNKGNTPESRYPTESYNLQKLNFSN
jgi:hypothetical protein